jgi:transposase
MMGAKERAFAPLCNLSLDALVPADHFYRHLDAKLELGFVRDLVADCYAAGGRPSIDPVVFFKLQLVMFFEGLRSERELVRVAADRLSLRWYLGYDLDEALPDHSSLTKIRQRYGLATFRRFFEAIVERCREAGLVWGKEAYFDATQVDANASLESSAPRFAVEAHLRELFGTEGPDEPARQPGGGEPVELPTGAGEAARDELAQANAGRHDWLARDGRPDRTVTRGGYRRRSDFEASTTDPDAALMARKGGGLHYGYHDHYAVDGGKARVILGVLVTPADVMENQPFLDMLWRVCFRWRLRPRQVTGDTTYATGENVVAVEDQGIRAYVPLADWDRTPFYGPSRFAYDPEGDLYRCPEGHELRRLTAKYAAGATVYRAEAAVCNACPAKTACTASGHGRTIQRPFAAEYLDRVRGYQETAAYQKAIRKRSVWVEPLFGEAKEWHGLGRFRLRGLWQVNVEALLVAAGQNLKRLLHKRGWGRRPFPRGAPGVAPSPPRRAGEPPTPWASAPTGLPALT